MKKVVLTLNGIILQSEVSIRNVFLFLTFSNCSIYISTSDLSQPTVQYHWYAVTGRLYLTWVSGLWVYKIISLGKHKDTTTKQVETNTPHSTNNIFKLIVDSPHKGLLHNRILMRPLQISVNKDKMKPL